MRIWTFECNRDCNRFRDMMRGIGVVTERRVVGQWIYVVEVLP
jgi:hypothetical protein